jgi:type IV secretory pathway TraG/TraD family ATPase VirD4
LTALYKDNADTIIGYMGSLVFLGGKEKSTLKEMAETLGKETIDTYNTGESRGREISHSLNYQKLGKELMSVDELAVMDGSKCILQVRGVRPFLSDKYDITRHPNYKYLSDADPRNAFDIEKFLNHQLKLKEKEKYETYEISIDEDYDAEPDEDAPDKSKRTSADYGSLSLKGGKALWISSTLPLLSFRPSLLRLVPASASGVWSTCSKVMATTTPAQKARA